MSDIVHRMETGISRVRLETLADEFVNRGIHQITPSKDDLRQDLLGTRQMRAYIGIDPTAPDLHIGHESHLLRLRALQEMGHKAILLIGGFTGMIGDPTDKSAARIRQTPEEVDINAKDYIRQAGQIVDFGGINPVEVRNNAEWLSTMNFEQVLELIAEFTVQQMLQRDMFQRRIEEGKPLGLHEIIYPTMQAYDSVMLRVNMELGGSDQIFNMLAGSTLVKRMLGWDKYVVAGKLLSDPTGKKIGKSEGNMITLNDSPLDVYEKVMKFSDAIAPILMELCTRVPMEDIIIMQERVERGEMTWLEAKELAARRMVSEIHGDEAAQRAIHDYKALISGDPAEVINVAGIKEYEVDGDDSLVSILVNSGLCGSSSQAQRLLKQHAVRLNGRVVEATRIDTLTTPLVLQVGKRTVESYRILTSSFLQ